MNWSVKQRLNFYTQEFRPAVLPEEIFRLQWQLGLNLLLLLVLGLGMWVWQSVNRTQLSHWQQQQALAQQALQEERQRRPPRLESPHLRQQVQQARLQLERSQQVLTYLSRDQLLASQSFAAHLRDLSDIPVRGVWLQHFSFSSGGRHLRLEGQLSDPALLAPYAEALAQRDTFRPYAFRLVDVQRSPQSALRFVLDSQPPAASLTTTGEVR